MAEICAGCGKRIIGLDKWDFYVDLDMSGEDDEDSKGKLGDSDYSDDALAERVFHRGCEGKE